MKATAIAMRQAQALEQMNQRLARIEAALGIGDGEMPIVATTALTESEPQNVNFVIQADDPEAVKKAVAELQARLQEMMPFVRIEMSAPEAAPSAEESEPAQESKAADEAETPAPASNRRNRA